ncbi:MAG: maleylpyruvate isomerase family mycothiol-dependent enzyme [Acidimicrobiales bacterium]
MPTYVDKQATVELLGNEYRQIARLCAPLTPEEWDTPTCLPGWSVRDVVSHVIGVEAGLLGEPLPAVDISHLSHMQNPIAEANELWVEAQRGASGPEMLARLEDVTSRRLAELEAMDQEAFDAPSWTPAGKDETYGRFMRIRHFDCYLHEQDIRMALGKAPRETVEDMSSALEEVATGLGYIVGRRARMPEGARVRIDLTGPAARTFLVEVADRASLVDGFDGAPTVGIELPAMHFLRLTGGRHDPGVDPEEDVVFTGDRPLGGQLIANLAFTI